MESDRGSQGKKEMSRGRTLCKISRNKTQQAVPRPIILHHFVDIAVAKTVVNRKFTLGDK